MANLQERGLCMEVAGGWGLGRAVHEKNDRDKWCQSRRPAHPLLAEPTVTCSPANVWNWQWAAGKAAIPLWCSYMFTQQLLQLFHMHTQNLIAFIHQDPVSKLYAPRSCRVLSCHWYRMITEHTSVIIRILPCQLLTSTTISLPNHCDSICIFGNAIKCSFAHICDCLP